MTHLDEKALAAKAWADLEFAASATGALEVANVTLPIEKVRALVAERVSSLPSSPVSELVLRLRSEAAQFSGRDFKSIFDTCTEAAHALTTLSTRNAELAVENGAWQRNMREAYESFSAMRNDLNELFPMQSAEADLLTGPEWSVACAAIVTAARDKLSELEREVKRLRYIVHECANALGNGAYIDPNCSIEFMEILPVEIRSVVRSLSLSTSPQGGEHE